MIFTICKQCVNQKLSWANQNQPCVNFFHLYANPKISVILRSFAKSWTITAYLDGVITRPTLLVQSVEVTSSGQNKFTLPKKSLHGLHYLPLGGHNWKPWSSEVGPWRLTPRVHSRMSPLFKSEPTGMCDWPESSIDVGRTCHIFYSINRLETLFWKIEEINDQRSRS